MQYDEETKPNKNNIFLIIFIILVLLVSGYFVYNYFFKDKSTEDNNPSTETINSTETKIIDSFNGSLVKGNFVWGGAMNLAWDEMNKNIIGEKTNLDLDSNVATQMQDNFNNPIFTKNDLDEESYYVKSGFGQETVTEINFESRQKFPDKGFSDLNVTLNPKDFISYAYFLKEVEYKEQFKEKDINFNGESVEGFESEDDQKSNIKISEYVDDDNFIINLDLKDDSDELYLAKGDYELDSIIEKINSNKYPSSLKDVDIFEAPKISFNINRSYNELLNKTFSNKGFENYFIAQMFENIRFDMDEKGAKVENEAAIVGIMAILPSQEKPRNFILDKPYWIIMKRSDSQNPYFITQVNNNEFMKVVD